MGGARKPTIGSSLNNTEKNCLGFYQVQETYFCVEYDVCKLLGALFVDRQADIALPLLCMLARGNNVLLLVACAPLHSICSTTPQLFISAEIICYPVLIIMRL